MNHHHNNTVDEAPQNLRKLNDFVSRYMGKMKPLRDELPPPAATAMEPSSTAAAPAVTRSIPKRPLSAYNIFFQNERDRILLSRRSSLDGGQQARRHTLHGKMGFAELARTIGRTWRKLDGSERQYYQDLAVKEKGRYERELTEYHLRSGRSGSASSASASAAVAKSSSLLSSLERPRDDDKKPGSSLSDAAAVSSPPSSHQNGQEDTTSPCRAAASSSAVGAARKNTTTAGRLFPSTTASLLETSPLGFGFVAKTAGDNNNTTTTRAATALMNSALATRATNVDLQGKAVPLESNGNNNGAYWSQYMAHSLEQLSEHYSSMPSIHNFKSAEGSSSGGVGGKGGAPGDALLARPASCPTPIMAPAAPPTSDSALLLPSSASSAGGAVPLNEAADFFASSSWRARPTATTNAEQQREGEEEQEVVRGDDYYDPLPILPPEQQGACSPRSEEITQQQRPQQQQQPFSSGAPGEGLFPHGAPPPPTIDLDSDMRDILTQLLESGK